MSMRFDYKKYAVLYVDDEEKSLKYFKKTFDDKFRVLVASNADEAFQLLQENKNQIAMLITDQRMPGNQGTQLLKKAYTLNAKILRVLVTAYPDMQVAMDAINTAGGIYRLILKPWVELDLETAIARGLEYFMVRRQYDELLGSFLSAQEQHDALVQTLPDLVLRIRGDGSCVACHAPSEMEFPLSPDEMVDRPIDKSFPQDISVELKRQMNTVLTSGKILVREFVFPRKEGNHNFESRMVMSGEDEVTALIHDSTNRKKLENEVKAYKDQLQELGEHLEDFLGKGQISFIQTSQHELVGYLVDLKISLSTLSRILRSGQESTTKLSLEILETMCTNIDGVLARIRKGSSHLCRKPGDALGLGEAVKACVSQFKNRTGLPCTCILLDEGITPRSEVAPGLLEILNEVLGQFEDQRQTQHLYIYTNQVKSDWWLKVREVQHGDAVAESPGQKDAMLRIHRKVGQLGGEFSTLKGRPGRGLSIRLPVETEEVH